MIRVEKEILIQASAEAVGKEIFRVEQYPHYMDNLEEVRILQREQSRQLTSWKVKIDGVELNWIEEESLYPEIGRMDYRLVEGDFQKFEGHWLITPDPHIPHMARVQLRVDYDLGLPAFEELIGEVLEAKVKINTQSLLEALKKRTENKED